MEQHHRQTGLISSESPERTSNKIFIKAIITGVLILLMLIPTVFIMNLVQEREQRQKQVIAEVSSKWATEQTITGPYFMVPYNISELDEQKKPVVIKKTLVILPETLNVNGHITTEQRPRSIYNVLLYRSKLLLKGTFTIQPTRDVDTAAISWKDAKLCIGIHDFKGIEERINIQFNKSNYELVPGLPDTSVDATGLSASVDLSAVDLSLPLHFTTHISIRGSEQLNFVPLSGNSSFHVSSPWANPSFSGNSLPVTRKVNEQGFTATWQFNKANLPFNTFLQDFRFDKDNFAFGVTMMQPADQYAKTMRSVKYAILFIGLTFALFFIIELMQKHPVHPVQYVLVGLALVIFYSLLLSISEFILFDYAYLIAALATIGLITLYAKNHFKSWRIGSVFMLVLSLLYAFIFVLIRLEDSALLVGSIGLFVVLALVMYVSRNINWYQPGVSKKGGYAQP